MPKLEEGPGHDFIQKRILHDEAVEQARLRQFFINMQCAATTGDSNLSPTPTRASKPRANIAPPTPVDEGATQH